MGIKEEFDMGFIVNDFGKVTGTVAGAFLPDRACSMVRFKADPGNNGIFLIGENVQNCVFPLSAGDDTGWNPVKNLNEIYVLCGSGSTNFLYYWAKF